LSGFSAQRPQGVGRAKSIAAFEMSLCSAQSEFGNPCPTDLKKTV
jgi:hypothetical protein